MSFKEQVSSARRPCHIREEPSIAPEANSSNLPDLTYEPDPEFNPGTNWVDEEVILPDLDQVSVEERDNQEMTYAIGVVFGPEMSDFTLKITQGSEEFNLERKKRTKYIVTYVTQNGRGKLRLFTEDQLPPGFHASDLPILPYTPAEFQRMLEQNENYSLQDNAQQIESDRKNKPASKIIPSEVRFHKKTRQAS